MYKKYMVMGVGLDKATALLVVACNKALDVAESFRSDFTVD